MKCRQCRTLLFDFMDESLSPDYLDLIRRHLADCGACEKYYQDEQKLVGFIHNSPKLKALRYRIPVRSAAADGLFSAPRMKESRLLRFSILKPALIALSLLAAAVVSYILWFEKRSLSESDSVMSDPKAFSDLDYILSDPIRDWAERRLIITVTDSRGEIDEAIVTSSSLENILRLKNEGKRK